MPCVSKYRTFRYGAHVKVSGVADNFSTHSDSRKLYIQPITFAESCAFVRKHHRHHAPPVSWKFGCAVNDGERVVGVIVVGRPVARHLDDGYTVEVTRACTDGTPHAASKLYAAAWRAARALGYTRLITYTRADESGSSLAGAGWREVYRTEARSWATASVQRPRVEKGEPYQRVLWEAT